jgi:hypothetical protein
MTYPLYLREKARQLRREKKLTIDEIAERLAIGRTTVFHWVRDMPRPQRCLHRRGSAHQIGSSAMQAKHKRYRDEAYELGRWEFPRLAAEPQFRDFVCMYIAEGYKRDRNRVSLCNSDPAVVRLADRWIRDFSRNPVTYSIQYHADQSIEELRRFWSAELGVSGSHIKFQRKSNSSQLRSRVWRCRYGVISVRASDTVFRARLQGWIDRLEELWLDSNHGA